MKLRNIIAAVAASTLAAGTIAAVATAADTSSTPSNSASKPAQSAPTPSPTATPTSTAPSAVTVTATVTETAKPSASGNGPTVTNKPSPTYTAPKWLQPSSKEEEALDIILKVTVWVTAASSAVAALITLLAAVPGYKDQINTILNALK